MSRIFRDKTMCWKLKEEFQCQIMMMMSASEHHTSIKRS